MPLERYVVGTREAIRKQVSQIWPETVSNGIFFDLEMLQEDWDTLMAQDETPLPLVAIKMGGEPCREFGVANFFEKYTTIIHYIAHGDTPVDTILEKCEDLRIALWPSNLDLGQVIEKPRMLYEPEDMPLAFYFFNTGKPFRAMAVGCEILSGVMTPRSSS